MAFDLTGLSAYTKEAGSELLTAAVLKGSTIDRIGLQVDVKTSERMSYLSIDDTFQAGACGWNASGNIDIVQRTISVDKIKQNVEVCIDDLEAMYTQTMLKGGSYNDAIPFEQQYAALVVEGTQTMLEDLVWRGNKSTGTGNMAFANGLLVAIDADSTNISCGTTTAITASNIIDRVDEMVDLIPTDVLASSDLELYLPLAHYRMLLRAYRNANLFHYTGDENEKFEFVIPGTNVTVVGTRGLNQVSGVGVRWVLAEASNLVFATDMMNDYENFSIGLNEHDDMVRLKQKFKAGTNIKFTGRIVELTTTA